ncbi:MAG: RNA polymerase sigma factor [Propioniciclava sp.]
MHRHPVGDTASEPSAWDIAADAYARWVAGEGRALDDLVRALTPALWHTVRSYGLTEEAAQDTIQGAWLQLIRHRDSVRDPQAVGGWLITTARRLAWRATRAREIPVDEVAPDVAAPGPSPEDAAVAGLEATVLWRAVSALDARCRRLIRVIAFAERPGYAELSAETGMPIGSIGPTRRRCLDKLRTLIQGDIA